MSIRKRGRNSYLVQIELPRDPLTGRRNRRWLSVRGNKKAAEKAERDELYRVASGIDVDPLRLTLGEWLEKWLTETAAYHVRPTTLRRYRSIAARLTSILGEARLQQLRPAHLHAAYTRLREEKLSALTIRHYHTLLHGALKAAVRMQLIAVNPADAVTPPTAAPKEMRALKPDEMGTLIGTIEDEQLRRLVEVVVGTGLRIGEALAIRWSDIDFDRGTLRIERAMVYTPGEGVGYTAPKTDAGRRTLSLPSMAVQALQAQRKAQLEIRVQHADVWENNDLVFADELGRPLAPYTVSKHFTKAAEAAGFVGLTFHSLRHTHATMLLRAGVPDLLAAARLGHASPAVTRAVYQHVQPDMLDEVAHTIDRLLGGPQIAAKA